MQIGCQKGAGTKLEKSEKNGHTTVLIYFRNWGAKSDFYFCW